MYTKTAIVGALAASLSLVSAQINYGNVGTAATTTAAQLGQSGTNTGSAAVASGTHIVQVSNSGGTSLAYNPSNITAAMGDVVEFQFWGLNHSVTQAAFDKPCEPLAGGFFSGFMPVQANTNGDRPTFSITVNDTKPIWFYCAQTTLSHCQNGMVGAINAPSSGNTLDKFTTAAKSTKVSTSPPQAQGGVMGKTSTSSASGSSSASGASASSTSSSTSGVSSSFGSPVVDLLVALAMVGVAVLMS